MSLLQAMSKDQLSWSIAPHLLVRPGKRPKQVLRITLVDAKQGTTLVYDTLYSVERPIEDLVGEAMQHHLALHPATRAYRYSKGDGEVALNEGALEQLGVLLHTAMRKAMQGSLSSILHLAWRHCPNTIIVDAIKDVHTKLHALFEQGPVSRRELGVVLRDALTNAVDHQETQARVHGKEPSLALTQLLLALQEVPFTDWMWALPAFLVSDARIAEPA